MSCWKFPGFWEVFFETFYLHKLIKIGKYSPNKMMNIIEPDAMSGAALLFKKELIDKRGLFDEDLFWMEDVDLCYRNKKTDGRNIYFPSACIVHHIGKSAKKNMNIAISNQLISKLKFLKKHKRHFAFFFSAVFILIHIITRIIAFGMLALFNHNCRIKCNAYSFSLIKYISYIFRNNKSII